MDEIFSAPGPNGEIPTFQEMQPWLASHLHAAADDAEEVASNVPSYFPTWESLGEAEVFREVAGLVEVLPTADALTGLLATSVSVECDMHQITSVDLTDSAQRNDRALHIANGVARAWREVAEILQSAVDVLGGVPDGHIELVSRRR